MSARREANSVIRQYRLKNASLDDLVSIIGEQGFQIIDYEVGGSDYASSLISELQLDDIARMGQAFVYQKNDVKLLFLCEQLTAEEKLFACAHELGHIRLGHLKGTGIYTVDLCEEYEANEFVHYLLHPSLLTNTKIWMGQHKSFIAATSFFVVICLCVVFIIHNQKMKETFHGEYYVTETGEKYHLKDCKRIQSSDDVRRMTEKEYQEGKYTPCQVCLPDQ